MCDELVKRAKCDVNDAATRRIWRCRCGGWRVVESVIHYALHLPKTERYPPVYRVEAYRSFPFPRWTIISTHRTKAGAERALSAHRGKK